MLYSRLPHADKAADADLSRGTGSEIPHDRERVKAQRGQYAWGAEAGTPALLEKLGLSREADAAARYATLT